MKNELWHAIAGGLLSAWYAKLNSVNQTNRDLQNRRNVWSGWLTVESYGAMGYTLSEATLGLLWNEIPDRVSNPEIRSQIAARKPPLVSNPGVSGGNTLIANDPGADITTMVYSWNAGTFQWTEVGPLETNSQPGAGTYVLINSDDLQEGNLGLPTVFLTLSS